MTNPTWAPIFQKIAAAVSDIGGSMSHAAIVAREYGLPAVVGTGNCHVAHQGRPAHPRRWRPRHRDDAALSATQMASTELIGWFADIGLADRPHGGRQGRQPR